MEEHFVTDYMKDKERQMLFKGAAEILIGFMLVLIAIFIVAAFYYEIVPVILAIAGLVCFAVGIFTVKKVLCDKTI